MQIFTFAIRSEKNIIKNLLCYRDKMKSKFEMLMMIVLLFGIDQISKYFFYTLAWGSDLPFLSPVFNTGISRWIKIPMIVIIIFSLLCMGLIIALYRKNIFTKREFGLFVAGTLGNLFDRLFFSWVRDFISLGNFPVFNVADMLLSGALLLFVLREFFPNRFSKK